MKSHKLLKTIVLTIALFVMCSMLFCGCDENNVEVDNTLGLNRTSTYFDSPSGSDNSATDKQDLHMIIKSLDELNTAMNEYGFSIYPMYGSEFFEENALLLDFFTASYSNEIKSTVKLDGNQYFVFRKYVIQNGVVLDSPRKWTFIHEIENDYLVFLNTEPNDIVIGREFIPFTSTDNTPIATDGLIYTMQQAYDLGYISHEALQNISYYKTYGEEYPTTLSEEEQNIIKERYAYALRNDPIHPDEDIDASDVFITGYYGTYDGAVAVMIVVRGFGYIDMMRYICNDDVPIVYSNGNSIVIYK